MNKFSKIISIMFVLGVVFVLSSCGKKEHIHEFDESKIIQDATCTTEGIKEYKCNGCSETKQETIQKLEHIYETTTVKATCAEAGVKTKKCKLCDYIVEEEIIEKLEHTVVVDKEVAATCSKYGLGIGSHCSECGEVIQAQQQLAKKAHEYINNNCKKCGILKPTEGLKFQLSDDGTSYILVGRGTSDDNIISIPKTYNGLPVSAIADKVFYGNYQLQSVTIPDSILSIGKEAFSQCRKLTEIIFENDAQITEIGQSAFYNCISLKEITIPKNLLVIRENAFEKCNQLDKIIFENDAQITEIGQSAFYNCISLKEITIPKNLLVIGESAFRLCEQLWNLTYEEGSKLDRIESKAFYGCNFKTIIIPENVTYIEKDAFVGNYKLENVDIHENNKQFVLENGFLLDLNNEEIYICFLVANPTYDIAIIPEGVTTIVDESFEKAMYITDVEIPKTVTSIGKCAFNNCNNLENVIINAIGASIGDDAFRSCVKLTYIKFNNEITMIGEDAFTNCISLSEIILPDGVTKIGRCAFDNCKSLTRIDIPKDVTYISEYAFEECENLKIVNYRGTVEDWCNISFGGKKANPVEYLGKIYMLDENNESYEVKEIIIPDTITVIGQYQFCGFKNVTKIVLPETITEIRGYAFYNCSSLEKIFIPDSVVRIQKDVFGKCDSLTIYCETKYLPDGWDSYWISHWNSSKRPVVWGYQEEQ